MLLYADLSLGCLTSHDALANGIPMVTLPPEFIRGRFTSALYRQMGHSELVASDANQYVQLVEKLLKNDTFQAVQSTKVSEGFAKNIHQNGEVANEWLSFMLRVLL